MEIANRLTKLRELMEKHQLHAYIVPSSDPHLSEYVAEHYKSRQWISGFTGSAGTAVITLKDAGLWTDGRYYIQAEKQLQNTGITLFRGADPKTPSYTQWLKDKLPEGSTIAFDGRVFSAREVKKMQVEFDKKNIKVQLELDLIGELWTDRPPVPAEKVFVHELKYAGLSRKEKLQQLREKIQEKDANVHLLSVLDDLAWLLNIRGNDVPHNPVTIAHLLITQETCYLCIDKGKISPEMKSELIEDGIQIKDYQEIETLLQELQPEDRILLDPSQVNARLYYKINPQTTIIEDKNPTLLLKAVKNSVELENMKKVNIYDGVAMVKFTKWLKENVGKEEITELTAEDTLEKFRRQHEECVDISFDTISAYKDHAAMMHYKA
ncbi:MAG: M24 family metallopeptidase, partial [Desulfitobacterium sp.]|nr:M24 family metallopeptidase [Desulfitobacterium sp.]